MGLNFGRTEDNMVSFCLAYSRRASALPDFIGSELFHHILAFSNLPPLSLFCLALYDLIQLIFELFFSLVSGKQRSFLGERRSSFLGEQRSLFLGKRRSSFLGE